MTEGNLAIPIELLVNVERYAVYRCYGEDGQLLYVGETGDLGTRFAAHAKKLWFLQVRGITLEWYADELDALKVERRAIHVEHPKYNKIHRSMTNVQAARGKPKRGRKPVVARRKPVVAREPGEARQAALAIYTAEPGIKGAELGRRVDRTPRWGQLRKAEFDAAAPKGQELNGARNDA